VNNFAIIKTGGYKEVSNFDVGIKSEEIADLTKFAVRKISCLINYVCYGNLRTLLNMTIQF